MKKGEEKVRSQIEWNQVRLRKGIMIINSRVGPALRTGREGSSGCSCWNHYVIPGTTDWLSLDHYLEWMATSVYAPAFLTSKTYRMSSDSSIPFPTYLAWCIRGKSNSCFIQSRKGFWLYRPKEKRSWSGSRCWFWFGWPTTLWRSFHLV